MVVAGERRAETGAVSTRLRARPAPRTTLRRLRVVEERPSAAATCRPVRPGGRGAAPRCAGPHVRHGLLRRALRGFLP